VCDIFEDAVYLGGAVFVLTSRFVLATDVAELTPDV
jgi:hypothetical protein